MTPPLPSNRSHLFRILGWLILALLLTALAAIADGQEPTPKPHRNRTRLAFLLIDAGVRGLDVYSTQRMLSHGGHEMLMPGTIAGDPAAMGALEASDIVGVWYLSKRLARRDREGLPAHPELSRWIPAVDAAADAPWAIHNLFIEPKKPIKLTDPFPKITATH